MQLYALFKLGFPSASDLLVLNLAAYRNSPVRSTKSTRLHLDRALSACKHRVSGSLSLPSRGSFHLSLTVLSAIGHHNVFSLGWWSTLLPAGFLVSCGTLVTAHHGLHFNYGAFTLFGGPFQVPSSMLSTNFIAVPQPRKPVSSRFGLFPVRSPLLRKSLLLSFPPGT